jgi:uncharacterized protein YoxC
MISAAIIAVCCVAIGVLYVVATNRKYERLLKEKKEKEIRDAEEELRRALRENKQDVLLHATLYDRLKRLRGK